MSQVFFVPDLTTEFDLRSPTMVKALSVWKSRDFDSCLNLYRNLMCRIYIFTILDQFQSAKSFNH